MPIIKIVYIVCPILIIIFTTLLIIIYSKDKYFQGNASNPKSKLTLYPCYFNIFFCVIIVLNNVLRIIPESLTIDASDNDHSSALCWIQAFMLSLLDKLLIALMTVYSVINYLSQFHSDFYKNNLKKIYLTLIAIGFSLSLILSSIYIGEGTSLKDVLCYIHTRITFKIISDGIYTVLLFVINLYCLIKIIINLVNLNNQYMNEQNLIKYKKSNHFLKRFIFDLIINVVAFVYIFLVVMKTFPAGSYKDIIYIITCLAVELFYTINESLYKAFIRLITCNKYYPLEESSTNNQEETQDEEDCA